MYTLRSRVVSVLIGSLAISMLPRAGRAAPLGTAFTYQGQLQQSGVPATGSCDMQFSLFDAGSGGAQIGSTQPASAVSLSNGLFTVPLDFGSGVFAGADRYLEIQVRCPGGGGSSYVTLSPRQKLTAAPYALYAPTAGNLSCSGCVTTGDLASGAVTGSAIANGTIQPVQLAFTPVLSIGANAPLISSGGQNPTVSLNGVVAVANGGTAASTALTARSHLGAAASGANADITSLSGITGNIVLPESTANAGNILKGIVPFIHNFGSLNTFVGENAGNLKTLTGGGNTAVGWAALTANTGGPDNTAMGANALSSNTTGGENTALGSRALHSNTTGSHNTAVGFGTLYNNQTYDVTKCTAPGAPNACCTGAGTGNCEGDWNTAVGVNGLYNNTTGRYNTAVGRALYNNTSGADNTAVGVDALYNNDSGDGNVAVGRYALYHNMTGGANTAVGGAALVNHSTGDDNTALGQDALAQDNGSSNTAVGQNALYQVADGSNNIALGVGAGASFTANESHNIDIGNAGTQGERNTLRIGSPYQCLQNPLPPHNCLPFGTGQRQTFIAGISGATSSSGVTVYVDSNGQLGTITSSARFKTDIQDMSDASSGLLQLRPVRFRYNREIDPAGLQQYGLVAEEVGKVYPDLVTYDEEGRPESVRYHFVNAMLLNEVQKQARQIAADRQQMKAQGQQIEALIAQARQANAQIEALTARLVQVEATVSAQGHAPAAEASYRKGSGSY